MFGCVLVICICGILLRRFPKNVVYFDSNAELNIFVVLHPNHFGPGLKHLQLHCFWVYVNPNVCMKYLVLTVYVVFKFNRTHE